MKTLLKAIPLTLLFLVIGAGSVSAHPGHTSCRIYGEITAEMAQNGELLGTGAFAASGPNVISDVNIDLHTDTEDRLCTLK